MRSQRSFSLEFKRQIIQELLSGESGPAQLCWRHGLSSSLLYHWKRQYARGKFDNEPTEEATLKDRVEKLERLVGKLTLKNEFLKKGLQSTLSQPRKTGACCPICALRRQYPAGMRAYEPAEKQLLLPAWLAPLKRRQILRGTLNRSVWSFPAMATAGSPPSLNAGTSR